MTEAFILPEASVMKTTAIDARRARLSAKLDTMRRTIFDSITRAANSGQVSVELRFEPISTDAASELSDWLAGHGYAVSNIGSIRALDMVHGLLIDWSGK